MRRILFTGLIVLLTSITACSVVYADELVETNGPLIAEFGDNVIEHITEQEQTENINQEILNVEVIEEYSESVSENSDAEVTESDVQCQEEQNESLQSIPDDEIELSPITYNDQMYFEDISSKNLNKFKALKTVISDKQYSEQDLSAYNYFISSLSPIDSEIEYINEMFSEGHSMVALIQVYEYWKDTAEDLSIIEDVLSKMPENYQTNPYWIDDAFLDLSKQGETNVEYSDLSVSDVRAYIDNGYTYDDLIIAERLSRKGVLSIEEILEERGNGKLWNDLLEVVYDVDFNQATDQQINNMNLSVRTLKIIDISRAESAQTTFNLDSTSVADSLYIKKVFSGYNEYVVNAQIIRDLEF